MKKDLKNHRKFELLAPAGNIEKMKVALKFGADAVYAGIPDYSLRVRINDFNLAKIKEAADFCHKNGKKIYITINIFAHNKHLTALPKYVRELKKIGVDALIITDPGVIMIVKKIWPKAEIHLSTQANCTNLESAKFWHKLGVSRVILGREVTLKEIKEISKGCPKLELEYFIHGAMCMSYSGRCFLSKYYLDRSGNLGDCVQPCRWNYYISEEKRPDLPLELVEEEHGSYILNSKDLCLIEYLPDLIEAGVTSFKIEGRAKSVYYQAVVAGIYRQTLGMITSGVKKSVLKKEILILKKELETKLVHRGYTKGFLLGGDADQNINESHLTCDWEYCGQVMSNVECQMSNVKCQANHVGSQARDGKLALIKVHNSLKVGDTIEIIRPYYDIIEMKVEKMYDAKTGKELKEAHGGQDQSVLLEVNEEAPELSVIRRVKKQSFLYGLE